MHRYLIYSILLCISLTLQSCYFTGNSYTFLNPQEAIRNVNERERILRYHMQPYQLDAPMLNNKGDKYLRIGITNGISLSGAAAVNERWRWHGGLSYGFFKKTNEENAYMKLYVEHYTDGVLDDQYDTHATGTLDDVVKHKQLFLESSMGYRLNPGKKVVQEVYGGLGIGSSNTIHELELKYEDANQPYKMKETRKELQGFIQYNLGTGGNVAEINTMHRLAYGLHFNQVVEENPLGVSTAMRPNVFFYTGALRMAAGKKKVRMFLQYEWLIPFDHADLIWKNTQFSAGIVFRGNRNNEKQ